MLKHVPISELKASMKEMYELWVKYKSDSNMVMVEMKRWFGDLSLNTVVRMLVGKRFSSDTEDGFRFQKPVREFFELVGMFVISDYLSFLRWLDLGGYQRAMNKTAEELD